MFVPFKRGVRIEEMGSLLRGLVEALASSFSFCGNSPFDLRVYLGLAVGVQGPFGALSAFDNGGHPYHVDDLLYGRMERSGGGSHQSRV